MDDDRVAVVTCETGRLSLKSSVSVNETGLAVEAL